MEPNGIDGINGEDGVDGTSIISEKTVEPAGENCPYGGIKITIGTDLDGDWEIDLGSEILTTLSATLKSPIFTIINPLKISMYLETLNY